MSALVKRFILPCLYCAVFGALTACSTITPHQRLEMDRAHCRMIGFPDRSIPMAECVQRRELDRSADRRAREEALDRWMYDRPYRHWRYHPWRYHYPLQPHERIHRSW